MAIKIVLALVLGLTFSMAQRGMAQAPTNTQSEPHHAPAGYKLVWADEFSKDGLPDAQLWRYDTSRNKAGWYNQERQYYAASREKNARITNGHLIIEAHEERLDPNVFPDWGKQKYTSARLITQGVAS